MLDGDNFKEESIVLTVDNVTIENTRHEHPIQLDGVVICDLASSIMDSKIDEPSPLKDLDDKTLTAIAELTGTEVLSKHLSARDRKKEAKFREIENAVVTYVTQNCSCYQHM